MKTSLLLALLPLTALSDIREAAYGARLPGGGEVALWTVESGWKVGRTKTVPTNQIDAVRVSAAANEVEAVQLVATPPARLDDLVLTIGALRDAAGHELPASCVEILRVGYVNVQQATDKYGGTGPWPDPLPHLTGSLDVAARENQPFWIRVTVPKDATGGVYRGTIALAAGTWRAEVPLELEVYPFALPDRLTCETAFGFSAHRAFQYHGAKTEAEKRQVLEHYWRSFAAHHISPYDPAPLDRIRVQWPAIKPPPAPWADWAGGRVVTNEAHTGVGSMAVFDDRQDKAVGAAYEKSLPIPAGGFRLKFAYRTALPGHACIVAISHFDADGKFIPGHNRDIHLQGDGRWQLFDEAITNFPAGARTCRLALYGTTWTEGGEKTGLVWFDDVHVSSLTGAAELVQGGDFEPVPSKRPLVAPLEQLKPAIDFTAWDREMERVFATHRFSSFRLHLEGMGGGTYEELHQANLLGFRESDPEYEPLFGSYVRQLRDHLEAKGWLGMAYTYWFDEPEPSQYAFVRGGFEKLRRLAPGLRGMLTEEVHPGLIGGPSVWCPVSPQFREQDAEERRKAGEHFWWYVCCGPKGPFATEFTDHPGTALRAWLWQTWQRKIEGILIWESNYWTSPTAYPDHPQNPYEDPMCWVSGGNPGAKHPWGNGDGRFIYPPERAANGRPAAFVADPPVDSIRWEMLRDGLEDYEYLALLKRRLDAAGNRDEALRKLLEVPPEISRDIQHFTHDPAPIAARRQAIARAIASLP